MNKTWKNISTYAIAALVSVGATYGTYKYLDASRESYTPPTAMSYGSKFLQSNFHLAGLNESAEYPDFTSAAESTVHAVVHIKSTVKNQAPAQQQGRRRMVDPFEYFFGFGDRGGEQQFGELQPKVGFGSGVIIAKDGYIITNNHVIDKATEIEVTLNDNSKYNAKLVGTDPVTDIALLKIEGSEFPFIPFGDSDKLKVGEWVLAVGNPFNLTSTVTAGIVSAKGRGGIGDGRRGPAAVNIQSFIQTDAAVNPGNSGGALVNTRGELIGINTAIYSETGNFAGYSFAVPISIAGKIVADIKEYGTVQRAVLGVLIRDLSDEKELNPDKTKDIKAKHGVYVGGFAEQSPAKQAGIEEGDIITTVNNTTVRTSSELQEQINRYRPGDKVKLKAWRNNSEKEVVVTLKTSDGSTSVVKKKDGIATAGAAFKTLTNEVKTQHGISYGVEVAGVDSQGAFHKEGVSKGFIIQKINNQPVNSPEEIEALIQSASSGSDKVLFIAGFYPATGAKKYYAIDLNK